MKKAVFLFLIILALYSCTVQKKQYYIFSRYTPYKVSSSDSSKVLNIKEEIHSTDLSVNNPQQNLPVKENAVDPDNSNVERKISLRQRGSIKNTSKLLIADDPAPQKESLQPVHKERKTKSGNGLLFLAASLIALPVIVLLRTARSFVTRLTRWAKANPRKTQVLIAGMHLPLLGLGISNGYNLSQMGYEISEPVLYGFGSATLVGFLMVPLLAKTNAIAIPRVVNRNRLTFAGIAISSLMLTTGIGNRIDKNYTNTRFAQTVSAVDQSVFSAGDSHTVDPVKGKTEERNLKQRKLKAGISLGAAIVLIFLLTILTCAGVCLIIGGAVALGDGFPAGILAIIAGALVFWAAMRGFRGVKKGRELRKMEESKKTVEVAE